MKKFPYEVLYKIVAGIEGTDSSEVGWYYETDLFIISDGKKYGVAYNKNQLHLRMEKEYVVLIKCMYDHIHILDTEYGDFVVGYSGVKNTIYSLFFTNKCIEKKGEKFLEVKITSKKILSSSYIKIEYNKLNGAGVFLLSRRNEDMQYYDIINKTLSEVYNYIYLVEDNVLGCYSGETRTLVDIEGKVVFPELPENFFVRYLCRYENGKVFILDKYREEHWETILLFYSEESKLFYISDVYESIDATTYTKGSHHFYLSGFTGIKNSKSKRHAVISDDDLITLNDVHILK